jgi:hypothetical protein
MMVRARLSGRRRAVTAFAALVAGCASADRSPAQGASEPSGPTCTPGRLGHSLGTYLTIEGIRRTDRKKGSDRSLLVDRINGQDVSPRISIRIENVRALPEGVRCILNGYESGRMIGLPRQVVGAENLPVPQAQWQFYRYFIVTSVVAPPELKEGWAWPAG